MTGHEEGRKVTEGRGEREGLMDDHLFDELVRRLTGSPSRRVVITGLVPGALGLLMADEVGARKRRKKKKKKPKRVQTTPPPSSATTTSTTQPPFCSGKPDDTYCGPTPPPGKKEDWLLCSGGICTLRPTCDGKHQGNCSDSMVENCCSKYCDGGLCACSTAGYPCYNGPDCCGYQDGVLDCAGYVCQAVSRVG